MKTDELKDGLQKLRAACDTGNVWVEGWRGFGDAVHITQVNLIDDLLEILAADSPPSLVTPDVMAAAEAVVDAKIAWHPDTLPNDLSDCIARLAAAIQQAESTPSHGNKGEAK